MAGLAAKVKAPLQVVRAVRAPNGKSRNAGLSDASQLVGNRQVPWGALRSGGTWGGTRADQPEPITRARLSNIDHLVEQCGDCELRGKLEHIVEQPQCPPLGTERGEVASSSAPSGLHSLCPKG